MITIRRNESKTRIWLQFDEKGTSVIGAIQSEQKPEIEGLYFSPVNEMTLAGIFADSDDRLLTFDDDKKLVKNEVYQPRPADVIKPVTVPEAIEHRGKQFPVQLWAKGGYSRLYVKSPKGTTIGYWDLKSNEWDDADAFNFANDESKQEFLSKVEATAKGIK